MTPFEHVVVLLSFVISLALAHLLSGWVSLIQARGRVRFSAPHVLWSVIALLSLLDLWLNLWLLRARTEWPVAAILALLAAAILLFLICAFLIPSVSSEGETDLQKFHLRERRIYLSMFLGYAVVGAALNATLVATEMSAANPLLLLSMLVFVAAIVSPRRWIQVAAPLIQLAVLAAYFATFLPAIR